MARGLDRHNARKSAVAGLGRSLSRRARNRCELCSTPGSLTVVEVAPLPEEPDPDQAVILCARCAGLLAGRATDPSALRFLEESIWAEIAPVQVAAVRLVRDLRKQGVHWASETLENLYLDPDIENRL